VFGNFNYPTPNNVRPWQARQPHHPKFKKRSISPHILTNLHIRYLVLKISSYLLPISIPPPPIQISTAILVRPLLKHPPYLFYLHTPRGVYFSNIIFLLFTWARGNVGFFWPLHMLQLRPISTPPIAPFIFCVILRGTGAQPLSNNALQWQLILSLPRTFLLRTTRRM
jgi:hypothetical protein